MTKWDAQTDIPTIKLGDFGLGGISSKAKTICGTEGYVAPELMRAVEELQKQKKKGMEAVQDIPSLMYTNAIDIWALGKILKDLIMKVPSVRRGKPVPGNKEPALHLIDQMMQDDPDLRPTAAECWEHHWMATINNSESVLTQKRGRSPTPGPSSPTSSAGQPLRKVIRMAFRNSVATEEGSTAAIMKAIWPGEMSEPDGSSQNLHRMPIPSNPEMKDRSSYADKQLLHDHPLATQLTIQLGDNGRLSLIARGHNDALMLNSLVTRDENHSPAILADNAVPQGAASSSMQDVARRLLAALQAEGYGNNVTIAGSNADVGIIRDELSRLSISSVQLRQQSQSSVMLGIEFDNEERTSSFWNEIRSVNRSIGLRLGDPADRNITGDASRPRSFVELLFNQVRPASVLDEPWVHRQELVRASNQFSMPAIALNGGAITDKALSVTQPSVSSIGNNSSWSSEATTKGVTYPSYYNDIMAGISF